MPNNPKVPEYDHDVDVRWVRADGVIKWKGAWLGIGCVLRNQPVGLTQIAEDEWEIHYGPVLLGHVLRRNGKPVLERVA